MSEQEQKTRGIVEGEINVPVCPFCAGPPMPLELPGGAAYGCGNCGAIGPVQYVADGPDPQERALKAWRNRGGLGSVRVAHVKPGMSVPTCAAAEQLYGITEKMLDGEFGQPDRYVLMLFDSVTRRLAMHTHSMDEAGIEMLCREVVMNLQAKRQQDQVQNAGLIVPGHLRGR